MGASPNPPPTALAWKGKRRQWMRKRGMGGGTQRRALLDGSRRLRSDIGVMRRVRTLRRLVPNTQYSMGLDTLFTQTAGYIMWLQMRVEVMKTMVNVLSPCD